MTSDTKTKLIGVVCAAMDGRELREYVLMMDGPECVAAHNVLKTIDDLLKAQWVLTGAPTEEDIL